MISISPNYSRGKSLRQAAIIRSCILPTGLPDRNLVLARLKCMVSWDRLTGEVKTLKYNERKSEIKFVSYDESWVYKKFMEHSHGEMEKPTVR